MKEGKFDVPPIMGKRPMIKAIETNYLGYRFRSRLEARFACFLHELDIRFHYETEGFFIDKKKYLPDFWLPFPNQRGGCWYEIKGQIPPDNDIRTLIKLAQGKGHTSYIVVGPLGDHKSLCATPNGHYIWEEWEESPFGQEHDDVWNCMLLFHPYLIGIENASFYIKEAILKAKQARFEFEERI